MTSKMRRSAGVIHSPLVFTKSNSPGERAVFARTLLFPLAATRDVANLESNRQTHCSAGATSTIVAYPTSWTLKMDVSFLTEL